MLIVNENETIFVFVAEIGSFDSFSEMTPEGYFAVRSDTLSQTIYFFTRFILFVP